ncbi:MAG: tripartite tricarboxylate transporter TctB family protein [Desulfovibrio sp.]|jgi:hypothetical protein|nr:tripartite tricarboxylate transporter TctB family protein [Desulfovibrio sp.]
MKTADYAIMSSILTIAAIFSLTETIQTGLVPQTDLLGSDGLPRALAVLAFLCCAWAIGDSILRVKQEGGAAANTGHAAMTAMRLELVAFGIFLYLLGFVKIGFCVSTFTFIAALTLYLESFARRHVPAAVAFALTTTGVCHYSFKFFNLLVPDALLF